MIKLIKTYFFQGIIKGFLVLLVFLSFFGLFKLTESHAKDYTSSLRAVLHSNGIEVPNINRYSELIKYLRSIEIEMPEQCRENAINYLYGGKANKLIKRETSKPGILTWYFNSVIFLKNDIIFTEYDDGEMAGGFFLLKVIWVGQEVGDMIPLWE